MTSNILFIVADDLNSWISPLGRHPDVKTPNIEKLARLGTTFTHTYCTAPYCNASRMSVFTGCLPSTTGVYANEPFWDAPLRRPTFLEKLRERGYFCFGAGKVFHGYFDYATAGRDRHRHAGWVDAENRPAMWDAFETVNPEPLPPNRPLNKMFDFNRFEALDPRNHHFDWGLLPDEQESLMPDMLTTQAVTRFLAAPPQQPFFCATGFYKPHLPWYVPKRFFDHYDRDALSLPFVKADDLDDVPDIAKAWALSPPDHETITSHHQWRDAVHGYLASISYCDHQIGAILRALESSPAADDTAVVLWGDNGFHLGEKLHWRKFVLWEEATRVPFIVIPPKSKAQAAKSRISEPVSLIDLFPTLFDLCGLDVPQQIDGRSLVSAMYGAQPVETPVTTTWLAGNHSLRWKNWRFTRYVDGSEELYDHAADPHEWNNLAGDNRFSNVSASLRARLPEEGAS
ncbi:sulfatase [Mesorhizobium sp. LjRoot246]|uniref:sulfatase n=1 Tax=Mesorhizobium sp. LjRoot246 TaxID=3342294 RepID=UPI003ED13360